MYDEIEWPHEGRVKTDEPESLEKVACLKL